MKIKTPFTVDKDGQVYASTTTIVIALITFTLMFIFASYIISREDAKGKEFEKKIEEKHDKKSTKELGISIHNHNNVSHLS